MILWSQITSPVSSSSALGLGSSVPEPAKEVDEMAGGMFYIQVSPSHDSPPCHQNRPSEGACSRAVLPVQCWEREGVVVQRSSQTQPNHPTLSGEGSLQCPGQHRMKHMYRFLQQQQESEQEWWPRNRLWNHRSAINALDSATCMFLATRSQGWHRFHEPLSIVPEEWNPPGKPSAFIVWSETSNSWNSVNKNAKPSVKCH